MKKKFTIIVVGNKRRICSIEISTVFFITTLSVIIALISILVTIFMVDPSPGKDITIKSKSANAQTMTANHNPANTSSGGNNHREAKDKTPANVLPRKLTVEDFNASYDSGKKLVRYRFLLKNHSEEATTSGHIFIIMKPDIPASEPWFVFPKTVLNDGKPKNFKDGEPFSISKYKIISNHISVQNIYHSILIYVFSSSGSLILEESFSIKNS